MLPWYVFYKILPTVKLKYWNYNMTESPYLRANSKYTRYNETTSKFPAPFFYILYLLSVNSVLSIVVNAFSHNNEESMKWTEGHITYSGLIFTPKKLYNIGFRSLNLLNVNTDHITIMFPLSSIQSTQAYYDHKKLQLTKWKFVFIVI
jgi:hypothetical protein